MLKTLGARPVHLIPGNRKPFLPWACSVFKEQLYRGLGKILPLNSRFLSQAVSRRSDLILNRVDKLKGPFDLVIGHNPGALYPTWYAAKKFGCKCGFDVEDYHPGEGENKYLQSLTKKLMNGLLAKMDYVTFAAPLMSERHAEDLGKKGKLWQVVHNLFPANELQFVAADSDGPLRLLWFSQNVNYNRGLEQCIPHLKALRGKVHLTVIGNKKEPFFSEYIQDNPDVSYMEPIDQSDLNRLICHFDVGLAIEQGKDYNNMIALSNKLISYYQAGLYILASDTPAQKRFFQEHPDHGMAVPLQSEFVADALRTLLKDQQGIRLNKAKRFRQASEKNWEGESERLGAIWRTVLENTDHVNGMS